jgi:hypothetical protein
MKRECDGCTLCCTLTHVPELAKPIGKTCEFCDRGCTVYEARPKSCRDFECAWLKGDMPNWMKPNKAHVMIESFPDSSIVIALPETGHEQSWKTKKVEEALKNQYQDKGISVIASDRLALLAKGHTIESVRENIMKVAKNLKVI